ncbi:hypothetical protein H0A66_10475 [Alcaligenaceae bacterium]|nr:hypothetical protein [Alcaligenaceae bacterium]
MSIIIRKNKHTARIMRQEYVRKGSEGNKYGFVRQVSLATISLSATEVPGDIAELLSTKELAHLEKSIIAPARRQAQRHKDEQEARERDPNWRVVEAIRWLQEAAPKTGNASMDRKLLAQLRDVVKHFGSVNDNLAEEDPLELATKSVRQAIDAVRSGLYGRHDGPVNKDTETSKRWAELRAAVVDGKDSLMGALQDTGWVVKRERASR